MYLQVPCFREHSMEAVMVALRAYKHTVILCTCDACVQGYSIMYPTIGINVLNSVYWLWLALYPLHI